MTTKENARFVLHLNWEGISRKEIEVTEHALIEFLNESGKSDGLRVNELTERKDGGKGPEIPVIGAIAIAVLPIAVQMFMDYLKAFHFPSKKNGQVRLSKGDTTVEFDVIDGELVLAPDKIDKLVELIDRLGTSQED